MSQEIELNFTCPSCGKTFTKKVDQSLNVTLDPTALDRVRDGSEVVFTCPECGEKHLYSRPLLYNDMKNNFMVQFAPDMEYARDFIYTTDELRKKNPDTIGKIKLRVVVGNYHEFIEKIEILSRGLDDVVIEFYKHYLVRDEKFEDVLDCFLEYSKDFSDKRFTVMFNDEKKTSEHYVLDENIYADIKAHLSKEVYFNRSDDYFVNHVFVLAMENNILNQEPIHYDLFRDKARIINVHIDELNGDYAFIADEDEPEGTKLYVTVGDKEYLGTVIFQRYYSEEALGIKFDQLSRPTRVLFKEEDLKKRITEEVVPSFQTNMDIGVRDVDLTDEEYDSYVQGDIIYDNERCPLSKDMKMLEKNTRIVVLTNHPMWQGTFDDEVNVIMTAPSYYKVIGKFEKDGKRFIILLHLQTSSWILFGLVDLNLEVLNENTSLKDLREVIVTRAFDKTLGTYVSTKWEEEAYKPVGYVNNKINIIKSPAELEN